MWNKKNEKLSSRVNWWISVAEAEEEFWRFSALRIFSGEYLILRRGDKLKESVVKKRNAASESNSLNVGKKCKKTIQIKFGVRCKTWKRWKFI